MFRQLLKISGVGARTALAVLSGMSVGEIRQAISAQDSARLTKIPGIGRKTAERLVLELKDKLDLTSAGSTDARGGAGGDVLNALCSLHSPADINELLHTFGSWSVDSESQRAADESTLRSMLDEFTRIGLATMQSS